MKSLLQQYADREQNMLNQFERLEYKKTNLEQELRTAQQKLQELRGELQVVSFDNQTLHEQVRDLTTAQLHIDEAQELYKLLHEQFINNETAATARVKELEEICAAKEARVTQYRITIQESQAKVEALHDELKKVRSLNDPVLQAADATNSITELQTRLNACHDDMKRAQIEKTSELYEIDKLHAAQLRRNEERLNAAQQNSAQQTPNQTFPQRPSESPHRAWRHPSGAGHIRQTNTAAGAGGPGRMAGRTSRPLAPASTALGSNPASPEMLALLIQALKVGMFPKGASL